MRQIRKIHKMATFENLPQELIDNFIAEEPSIFKNLNQTDIINCSIALVGTKYEKFVVENFLQPQLKIFATLPSLNESLRNEGWFEKCQDTKLILRLLKEHKPILPSMYHSLFKAVLGKFVSIFSFYGVF